MTRRRRRHGRIRRFVVRPFFWGLAIVAALVAAAVGVAESEWAAGVASRALQSFLGERLDRRVTVGGLEVDLLPLAAVATDVTVAGAPGEPPFATAERVVVEADLTTVLRPELVLRRVLIEAPVVDLRLGADGGNNLPSWSRRRPASSAAARRLVSVLVGQVEIERGQLLVDERRVPIELAARGVAGHLFGLEERVLEGRLAAAEIDVRLRSAPVYRVRAEVSGRFEPGRVELTDGRIEGPGLFAVVAGGVAWRGERGLSLEIDARGRGELVARLGLVDLGLSGPARFDGAVAWTPEAWGYRGTVTSPALELLDRRLRDVVAVVSGDSNQVAIDIERAGYGGGGVTGTVVARQAEPDSPVEVELGVEGLRLSRLLADQRIPVTGVEGRVTGTVSYRFTDGASRRGDGWAELAVARGVEADRLQMAGSATLSIGNGMLTSRAVRLVSDDQLLLAQGRYDLATGYGAFDWLVETSRVSELAALMPLPGASPGDPLDPLDPLAGASPAPSDPLWLPTDGTGRLEGRLTLEPEAVSADLTLDLYGVDAPGFTASRLRGPVEVSAAGIERMRLELERPGAELEVSGTIPFVGPEAAPPGAGAFQLAVDADGWPLHDIAAWLPFPAPFLGDLEGSLRLAGSVDAPVGTAEVTLAGAAWREIELGDLELAAEFDPQRVEISRARLVAAAGTVEASGGFGRDGAGLALEIAATGLDLARPPLAGRLPAPLAGRLTASGRVSGSLESPRLTAAVEADGLTLGARSIGRKGTATARLDWDGTTLEARATLPGVAELEGGGPAASGGIDLRFDLRSADLAPLAALALPAAGEVAGTAEGTLQVFGPAADRLTARLELERLTARRGGLELANLEPVVLALDATSLTVESLFIGVPGTVAELFLSGTVGLAAPHPLDLRLTSTLAAEWAELVVPAARLRGGSFDLIAVVRGTAAEPAIDGVGRLAKTRLLVPSPPLLFDNVEATVLFYADRVVIDRATARVAGGTLRAAGNVSLVDGWRRPTYRLQLAADDLDLRYPEGWLVRGDAEIQLGSSPEGRTLQGTVTLDRALYVERVEVGVASLLEALFDRRRIEVGETDEILATTQLNLAVRGPGALRVRNNLADLGGDLELTVRGSLARPVVFGRVTLDPGGTLVYSGLDYTIRRGQLSFANPFRVEPIVDLVATTDLREYDVVLTLAGKPERLNATFASDPPLADLEILSLLGGGAPGPGRLDPSDDAGSSSAAEGFLYGQATSLVTERVNRLFGLDRFRIDPLTEASGDLSSARVTVGEQLSRDLFATYSYDPTTTEQQILQLEWSVSRSLVLVLTQNGDGSYAVDARWEKAF